MVFWPAYEKCGLNPAKTNFLGLLRLSKFAAGCPAYFRLILEIGAV